MLGYHPPPGPGTHPQDQAPAWEQTHTPGPGTPQEQTTPPHTEHARRYGQRAGGTHTTEMQSCLYYCSLSPEFILSFRVTHMFTNGKIPIIESDTGGSNSSSF